jgi:O-antigen/teichoic acid export membrane protein
MTVATLFSHRSRLPRLFWLLADQGVFAVGNFMMNVLFARWLTPYDYGLFSISFSGYVLLSVVHYGAFLEPFLIQSGQIGTSQRRSYAVIAGLAHLLMIATVVAVVGVGLIVGRIMQADVEVWVAILGAGVGGSVLVTQLAMRRLCFVFLSPEISASVGVVYSVGVIGSAYAMHHLVGITWLDVWTILGAWSVGSSASMFCILLAKSDGTDRYTWVELLRFQRNFAGWSVISSLCSWIRGDGVYLVLARLAGVEAVAETRAVINLGNPLTHVLMALNTSWIVNFSMDLSRGVQPNLRRTLLPICAGAVLLVLATWLLDHRLMELAYGGLYQQIAWQLPIYFCTLTCVAVESAVSSALKAKGLMTGYAAQIGGALVAVVASLVFIPLFGQPGAIYANFGSFLAGAMISILMVPSLQRPNRVIAVNASRRWRGDIPGS